MLFSEVSDSTSKKKKKKIEEEKQRKISSLMFLCDLARKYIINFIILKCASFSLLWKANEDNSFPKGFFNVSDRCRDNKKN